MAAGDDERLARLRLIRTANVGPATYHALMARYQTATNALEALGELSLRGGRGKPLKPLSLAKAQGEWDRTHSLKGSFVFFGEARFPKLLSATEPPPVLILRGHPHLLHERSLSIVGARNASANGRKLASTIAMELGDAGYTIISGMARGIDTAAHKGSLTKGTCAVLAGGIDAVYPP